MTLSRLRANTGFITYRTVMPQAELLSFTDVSTVNEKRKISLRSLRLERSPAGAGQAGGKSFKLRFAI